MAMRLHHILRECNPCRSVASLFIIPMTASGLTRLDGNWTCTFPLLDSSSAVAWPRRRGIDRKPHSSYGIRSSTLLPYFTRFFCQDLFPFSHLAHMVAARVVTLSSTVGVADALASMRWQYMKVLWVERGRRKSRIASCQRSNLKNRHANTVKCSSSQLSMLIIKRMLWV